MFRIITGAIVIALAHAAHSLAYAIPAVIALFANLIYPRLGDPSFAGTSLLLALFIAANTLFVYATLRHMTVPQQTKSYWKEMMWQRHHTDFLLFSCLGFLLLFAFVIFCFDTVGTAIEFGRELARSRAGEQPPSPESASVMSGGVTLFFFGSQAMAGLFLFLAMAVWFYFSRVIIKAPAHSAGNYISSKEAIHLTRAGSWGIFAASLLVNGALSSLPVVFALGEGLPFPAKVTLSVCAYWPILHANMSLWVSTYDIYTAGYAMRKEQL